MMSGAHDPLTARKLDGQEKRIKKVDL